MCRVGMARRGTRTNELPLMGLGQHGPLAISVRNPLMDPTDQVKKIKRRNCVVEFMINIISQNSIKLPTSQQLCKIAHQTPIPKPRLLNHRPLQQFFYNKDECHIEMKIWGLFLTRVQLYIPVGLKAHIIIFLF